MCASLLGFARIVIDHVVPLATGGPDTDDNCRGLSLSCNAIKTALDGLGHRGVTEHLDWLKRRSAALPIVTGPPFAGKTNFVLQ